MHDTLGAREKLRGFFEQHFKEESYIIQIRPDTGWQAYLEFLYPNVETQEYMRNENFANDAERAAFAAYVLSKGFTVADKRLVTSGDLHYCLQFFRVDTLQLPLISAITLDLRTAAERYHGDYDGWETSVVK